MPSDPSIVRWGFPIPTGQSVSYWQRQVGHDELLNYGSKVELPQRANIVIIGSGITGCLAAKCCKETWPEKSVVVLEAREFCSGATGRNAGHCKSGSWKVLQRYEKEFGAEQAIKIVHNEDEAQRALVAYVKDNNVDCELWSGKSLDVPVSNAAASDVRKAYLRYRDAGGAVDHIDVELDPVSAARTTGLKTARACYARPAATVHPWKLAAHIMRTNLAKGVGLHTSTTVRSVDHSAKPVSEWTVCTDRGSILCNTVIHATNAYVGAYEPVFRDAVVPHPHICVQARAPTTFLGGDSRQNSYTVMLTDGATVSINPRTALDGTILFGGDNPAQRIFDHWIDDNPKHRIDDSFTDVRHVTDGLLQSAAAEFDDWAEPTPKDRELTFEASWSGILGMTPDRMPLIGEIPGKDGQWTCVALNGYGMTKVFTTVPGLVKLMNGASWEQTGLPEAYRLSAARIEKLRDRVRGRC